MRLCFVLCVLSVAATCSCGQRGVPPQEGIGNFGKVNASLFRGAQPDEAGIENLQRLGVKLIVNLRMPNDAWKLEEAKARACGIMYTNIPMGGLGRPNAEQVDKILALLEASSAPVFIHCQHGCDRTGTIIACYRIRHDQWSGMDALREARLYGMSRLERGMRSYVEDFEKARKETRLTASK
jgi:protein tyrosine/serine phosphatase